MPRPNCKINNGLSLLWQSAFIFGLLCFTDVIEEGCNENRRGIPVNRNLIQGVATPMVKEAFHRCGAGSDVLMGNRISRSAVRTTGHVTRNGFVDSICFGDTVVRVLVGMSTNAGYITVVNSINS